MRFSLAFYRVKLVFFLSCKQPKYTQLYIHVFFKNVISLVLSVNRIRLIILNRTTLFVDKLILFQSENRNLG